MEQLILRQAAIDALRKLREEDIEDYGCEIPEGFNQDHLDRATFAIKQLSPIQPDNGLQKLADEIATFKRCVKSDNSDYLTGYLCALSAVEGMIAEKREETT